VKRFKVEFILLGFLGMVGILGLFYGLRLKTEIISPGKISTSSPEPSANQPLAEATPTLIPTPTPIPLPDPKVYGPCREVPVLMYHHVQPASAAAEKNQKNVSMNNEVFAQQMAYLAQRGYTTITPDELLSLLVTGSHPVKRVVLTFDDGYADFYTYAYPELVKYGFRGTVFMATGLVGGADYLTWSQISEIAGSGLITFADHTWSHKTMGNASEETAKYEIGTAKTQLEEHGLGPVTSFAYPYGTPSKIAEGVLVDLGIKTAFTTIPGNYQCAKLPYSMRRTRIGNSPLSSYGL